MKARKHLPGRLLLWLGLAITLIGTLSYFLQYTPAMAEFDSRQPGLIISLVGLALTIWGFIRETGTAKVSWKKSLGVKSSFISLVLIVLYVNQTFFAFRQEEVQFLNGNIVLVGMLLIPNGEGPHPAVVMMHGAGEATRMGNFAEAQSLVRRGVAALIYDKRGSGASVGGHYRFDGYEALAADGVAAVNFLRGRSDMNPSQIGLWGASEGGWTTPMAASQIDDLAFMVIVSGGPVTPAEQGAYELAYRLSHQGFSAEVVAQALTIQAQSNDYIRTGLGRDELVIALQQAQGEAWFQAEGFSVSIPAYDELSEWDRWQRDYMNTDVSPLFEQMDFPILFVLATDDVLIPSQLVKTRVGNLLEAANHPDFEVKVYPQATHNIITAAPANCIFCVPDAITGIGPTRPWFAPGYLDAVSDWVTQRVETAD